MTEKSITELEREVEASRARLAGNLATLRAPATYSQFSGALKLEARDVFRDAKRNAVSSVREQAEGYIEELKARAAANPAAVLTLAAGLAWRFLQKPPIATALFGAGLYSLFRTPGDQIPHDGRDYLDVAKERLREQASDFGHAVRERAVTAGEAIAEKTSALAGDATRTLGDMTQSARETAADVSERLTERGAEMFEQSREAIGEAATIAERKAAEAARATAHAASENRDQLLLGAAGVAVIAALGLTLQRRFDEGRHPAGRE